MTIRQNKLNPQEQLISVYDILWNGEWNFGTEDQYPFFDHTALKERLRELLSEEKRLNTQDKQLAMVRSFLSVQQ